MELSKGVMRKPCCLLLMIDDPELLCSQEGVTYLHEQTLILRTAGASRVSRNQQQSSIDVGSFVIEAHE